MGEVPGFGQEAEDRSRGMSRSESLRGFLRKDKAGQGGHFRIDSRVVPSFQELWHDLHRELLPPAVHGPDRGSVSLDWLACLSKACSWPSPLLSVRTG